MGIFSSLKMFAILGAIMAIGGAIFYLMNLKADLVTERANNAILTKSVETQQEVIIKKTTEIAKIQGLNKKLLVNLQKIEIDKEALRLRFHEDVAGLKRDFGRKAKQETTKMTVVINRATKNVTRCFELSSGAVLEPDEVNPECPELVEALRMLEKEKIKRNEN